MSRTDAVPVVTAFPSFPPRVPLAPRKLAIAIAAALSQAWIPAQAQTPTVLTSGNIGPAVHSPNPSSSWAANNLIYVGNTATGSMSITDGGTVTNPGRGSIGHGSTAIGTVTVSGAGSSWTMTGGMYVGFNGKGSLLIEQGGKVNVGPGSTAVGDGSASVGAVTVRDAGSEWKVDGNITLTTFGTGTINLQSGGAVTISNGAGTLSMGSASNVGLSSTLNIGGASSNPLDAMAPGTLNAASITMNRAPATINFNHTSTSYAFAPTVTSASAGTHSIHQIAGTTNLTGDSSAFTGTTTVSGGTLVVTNRLGGSAVVDNGLFSVTGSFNGNATASGAGSVAGTGAINGNLNFTSGGILSGNQGGTLSVSGAINLANDTTVNVALGAASATPLFSAGNGLTLGGTLNVTDQGGFGAGVYRLFNYGGTLTNNGMVLGSLPAGVNPSNLMIQTSVIGQVNLASTFGMPLTFWDGSNAAQRNNNVVDGGSGVWRTDGYNWTNASGALNGPYQPIPSFAVFQAAAGTVTVDQSAGPIGVTGMQFATDGYQVQGDPIALQGPAGQSTIRVGDGTSAGGGMTAVITSVLTGASQLIKDDLGTLVLSGNNLYTGGTDVHAGTLRISSDANLGNAASGIAMTGGMLATTASFDTNRTVTMTQDGQFNVASGTTLGLLGAVSGNADLVKLGAGTLQLGSAANAYRNTVVQAGTLIGNAATISGNTSIAPGAALTFNQAADASYAGIMSGAGVVSKTGAGALTYTGNSAGFTGTTTVSGGSLVVASQLGGNAVINGGTINVQGTQGGNVTASGAGTVMGAGSIASDLTFSNGGVLTGKSGQTLTVGGNLALDNATASNFAVEAPLANVGGNLTLAGTLNVSSQSPLGQGLYRVFNYNGSLIGNAGSMTIGSVPNGMLANQLEVQTAVPGQVNLVYSGGQTFRFWDGGNPGLYNNGVVNGGSGVWSTNVSDASWTLVNGTPNNIYNLAFAVFQGAAGTVTVDQSAGAIGVTGMQFATNGYRIQGDPIALRGTGGQTVIRVGDGVAAGSGITATIASVLTGASLLVKDDQGTLVLSGNNLYNGGTEVRGGSLQVSSDANLGDAAGGITMSGGTLATTATFDTGRAVTLTQNGQFNVAAGTTLGLSGPVSGAADLIKLGAGTLQLRGVGNAYGNTLVQAGTLIGNAATFSGNIGNAATAVFDQSADASYTGSIGALGGVSGVMVKQGAGNLTLTGNSALNWSVQAGTLTSAAERFSGNVNIAASAALTFNQIADAAYGGTLSGAGAFIKTGAGTLTYNGDSSAYTGATSVAGGTLLIGAGSGNANAALGGAVTVQSGATLAGHGALGSGAGTSLTVTSGGTVSPGNAGIGTLTVKGNLAFNDGARYSVQTDPTGSGADLIHATGTAALGGGSVAQIGQAGNYGLRSTYKILSTDGGLSGTFGSVTSNFAFLDPKLTYDANNAYLTLTRNNISFTSNGLTPNQNAAAGAVDSIGLAASNPMYDAVALLPNDSAAIRRAFDQLSGEIHASAKTALIEDSRYLRETATDRLRSAFDDASAPPAMVAAYGDGGALPVAPTANRPVAWVQGFGAWGSTNGDGNAARMTRSIGGFVLGADAPVAGWRLGAIAGYSRNSFNASDRSSSGTSDNYHLGLYGGTQWQVASGKLGLRTGLAYTWHDIGTRRGVAFDGYSDSLKSSYSAGTFQVFGDLGYRVDMGRVTVEPFVNLAYVNLDTGRFKESGGAAALQADRQDTHTTYSTLGLRSSARFELGGREATVRGTLGWRHAFGDVTPSSTQAFSAGNAYTVTGVPIARNAALIEAGVDVNVARNATVGLSYNGMLASGARQHGVKANFVLRF